MHPTNVNRRGNPVAYEVTISFPEGSIGYQLAKEMHDRENKRLGMLDKQYVFVSRHDDVDYLRVVKEAPAGTPFILVEEKTRQNRSKTWTLLVHKQILNQPVNDKKYLAGKPVSSAWGYDNIGPVNLRDYRYIAGPGKFPGIVKQQILKLKNSVIGKDTLTEVTYL